MEKLGKNIVGRRSNMRKCKNKKCMVFFEGRNAPWSVVCVSELASNEFGGEGGRWIVGRLLIS